MLEDIFLDEFCSFSHVIFKDFTQPLLLCVHIKFFLIIILGQSESRLK